MAALRHLVFRTTLALLSASFSAGPLLAASPGDQDLIRDRQDRLLQEQQRRLDELRNLPGSATPETQAPAPEDTRCFTVHTIELRGADSLTQAEREQLIAPFIGQ